MKPFLTHWGVTTLGVFAAACLVPGIGYSGLFALLLAGLLLGFLNAFVRPVLLRAGLPLVVLSLGLFIPVLNALLLGLVGFLIKGFYVEGFWAALWGGVVISLATGLLRLFLGLRLPGGSAIGGAGGFSPAGREDASTQRPAPWRNPLQDPAQNASPHAAHRPGEGPGSDEWLGPGTPGAQGPMKTVRGRVVEPDGARPAPRQPPEG